MLGIGVGRTAVGRVLYAIACPGRCDGSRNYTMAESVWLHYPGRTLLRRRLLHSKRYNHRVRFTTILFDLDDTLYPSSTGLWPVLKERMNRYMIERLHIPPADVPRIREQYFATYGTTLRGLEANYQVDEQEYLAYVHDVDLRDYLRPDPVQKQVLSSLPTCNLVFTNADSNHARRVLQILELESCFSAVIDINRMRPYCKPSLEAFLLAMQAAGEKSPSKCVMIDDLPHTTRAAMDLGMYSLLFGGSATGDAADATFSDWRLLPDLLNDRLAPAN